MSGDDKQGGFAAAKGPAPSPLLKPLRAMLTDVDEDERYGLLSSLMADLGGERGATGSPGDQLTVWSKRAQSLEKEKAAVEDALRVTRADLSRREKQFEAEQTRGAELQELVDGQRERLDDLQKEVSVLEAQVTARNSEAHKAEVEIDSLRLKLQRAEMKSGDSSKTDRLEQRQLEVNAELEALKGRMEQLRADKDAEIRRLSEERQQAQTKTTEVEEGGKVLADLWLRLAATKPPLVEGHVAPNVQAAERLIDTFIELVRFVDDFDKSQRVFLSRYTKYNPSVKVPWDAYAKGDDLVQFVQRTIAPQGGRPVGPLKMRLRLLYSWIYAAMVGCDSAVESIGSELQAHLMGPVGSETDPNRKIRDYIRADGHLLFSQHISELRSLRLAETYGRG